MNFDAVFQLLLGNFKRYNIRFALIGGFALHVAGYSRMTEDIDFLVLKEDMPKVKRIMTSFGYDLLHESEDVANFLGRMKELGKVDFLCAHRQYAKKMLERAQEHGILNSRFKVKVLLTEDIIGLKVQSMVNDQNRYHRDMADIETLMRINKDKLNMDWIKEYFLLFEKQAELQEILKRIGNA